jgi:hypothetical protein
MQTLSGICKKGCINALGVLTDSLAAPKGQDRRQAFRLLLEICQDCRNSDVQTSICLKMLSLLESTDCQQVGKAASKLLISLKPCGGFDPNDNLVCSIMPHLHHQKPEVRAVIVHTLARFTNIRSEKVLHAILAMTRDVDPMVRRTVPRALALLVCSWDKCVDSDCDSDFEDDEDSDFEDHEDSDLEAVCETVLALLKDSDQKVSQSAALALTKIMTDLRLADKVISKCINALSDHLSGPSSSSCLRASACEFVPGALRWEGFERRSQDRYHIIAQIRAKYGSYNDVGHSSPSELDGSDASDSVDDVLTSSSEVHGSNAPADSDVQLKDTEVM